MFKVKEIKMSIGDRVVMIDNHELRRGTILNMYVDIPTPILVVEFDDGAIEKVYPKDVALEPKAERQEDEPVKEEVKEKKPVEKSEITITPEEFENIAVDMVVEFAEDKFMLAFMLIAFCEKLHKKLFAIEGEND